MSIFEVERMVRDKQAYFVNTGVVTISTSGIETPLFLFRNGVTNRAYISHLAADKASLSPRLILRIYKDPVITDQGTALTLTSTYSTVTPPVMVADAYKSPTLSSNGSLVGYAINSSVHRIPLNRTYWMDQSRDILVTAESDTNNTVMAISCYCVEVF
jgi:hypothetical protein